MSAVDEEVEGDSSAAGATGRRHLSATERKLMKKQVSAQVPICKFSFPGATRLLPAIFIKVEMGQLHHQGLVTCALHVQLCAWASIARSCAHVLCWQKLPQQTSPWTARCSVVVSYCIVKLLLCLLRCRVQRRVLAAPPQPTAFQAALLLVILKLPAPWILLQAFHRHQHQQPQTTQLDTSSSSQMGRAWRRLGKLRRQEGKPRQVEEQAKGNKPKAEGSRLKGKGSRPKQGHRPSLNSRSVND
jgi:hypothetical protein